MRRNIAGLALAALVSVTGACSALPSTGSSGGTAAAGDEAPRSTPTTAPVAVDDLHFFAKTSPWNQRVDTLASRAQWQQMLRSATQRVDAGGSGVGRTVDDRLYINTDAWTVPVVSGGVPTRIVCRQAQCGAGTKTLTLDVPKDVSPDPRYDGWLTIVDQTHDTAYDLWRARRETDGTISYQYARTWALDGSGYGEPGQPSARGSGLPLFAGLIMGGEIKRGQIDHALAISVPGAAADNFVLPASMTDGTGSSDSLPEGARLRLRRDVTWQAPRDTVTGQPIPISSQQRRAADAILQALRTYGAIVVDRSAVPALYAEKGVGSAYLDGSALQGITLDDFEVVGMGERHEYPVPLSATSDPTADPSAGSPSETASAGAR